MMDSKISAIGILGMLVSLPAFGQVVEPASFSAERFELSVDRDGVLNAEAAVVPSHLEWNLNLWLGGANDPVVLYERQAEGTRRRGDLVGMRIGGSLSGALALYDLVQIGLSVPLVAFQRRAPNADGATVALPSLQVVGIGNVRIAPKFAILTREHFGVDVAVIPRLALPALSSGGYIGDDSFALEPTVAVSSDLGLFRVATNVGARFRSSEEWLNLRVSHELNANVGFSVRLEEIDGPPVEIDLGISGATPLTAPFADASHNYLEALGGATYDFGGPLVAFAAAGIGAGGGYSTPDWRGLLGVRISSRGRDPDGDGITGSDDACARVAEDIDGFEDWDGCPDSDNDGDGVPDATDGAPDAAEDLDGFEDHDGVPDHDNDGDGVEDARDECPLRAGDIDNRGCPDVDTDGDGLVDRLDKCIDEREDNDLFDDEDGCPDLDDDGDGIVDTIDACRNEAGPLENRGCPDKDSDGDQLVDRLDNCPLEAGTPENHGCVEEQLVSLTSDRIEIHDRVYFDTNKATIRERSAALLANVAAVLVAHAEIDRLRIEGHTDDVGSREHNVALSTARARAVRDHLVAAGVEAERLEFEGVGFDRPIAENTSESGRATNRRVEFVIVYPAADALSTRIVPVPVTSGAAKEKNR